MTGRCEAWTSSVKGCPAAAEDQCGDCGKELCAIHRLRCGFCDLVMCECCVDTHEANCELKRKRPQSERLKDLRQKKA